MPFDAHAVLQSIIRSDTLFRQVIETELDDAVRRFSRTLGSGERAALIDTVLMRLEDDILTLLAGGRLVPEWLTVQVREEVDRSLGTV